MPSNWPALLRDSEPAVRSLVHHEAGVALLRFDTEEDLVQGVLQEALRSMPGMEWRGEASFRSWLFTLARRHLSGRRDYWFANKRYPGAILRLTLSGEFGAAHTPGPAANAVGPSTFAFRREQLVLITKALAMLLERDRDIVVWVSEGMGLAGLAGRLGVTSEAAERARSRAFERLRKAFDLVARPRG